MTQSNSRYRQSGAVALRLQQRTPSTVQVLAAMTSQPLLDANEKRAGLSIDNRSSAPLHLSFTAEAREDTAFLSMAPYSFLLLDQDLIVGHAISGAWGAVNGHAQVTEYI
jgi:hypothetical protein